MFDQDELDDASQILRLFQKKDISLDMDRNKEDIFDVSNKLT